MEDAGDFCGCRCCASDKVGTIIVTVTLTAIVTVNVIVFVIVERILVIIVESILMWQQAGSGSSRS